MKNIMKEVQAILTAIHCINFTSEHRDREINLICDYAFRRLFGVNTNIISLNCTGKTKEQIMSIVLKDL